MLTWAGVVTTRCSPWRAKLVTRSRSSTFSTLPSPRLRTSTTFRFSVTASSDSHSTRLARRGGKRGVGWRREGVELVNDVSEDDVAGSGGSRELRPVGTPAHPQDAPRPRPLHRVRPLDAQAQLFSQD